MNIFSKTTFLFVFIATISCSTMHRGSNKNLNHEVNYKIFFGKGLGDLIIDSTTRRDVHKLIGKGRKTRDTTCFRNDCSSVIVYVYDSLGLELYYNEKWKASSDTLTEITLHRPCKFKTIDGIGIGSSREEIEMYLGKPKKVKFWKLVNGFKHEITYDRILFILEKRIGSENSEKKDIVREISFW